MLNDEIIEFTEDIKSELLNRGWTQELFEDELGKVCLLGASFEASKRYDPGCRYIRLMWESEIRQYLYDTQSNGIVGFNDDVAKSIDDVMDMLNGFIKNLRG